MKQLSIIHFLVILAFGLSVSFCSRPKEVMNRTKMEKVMYDIYIAEAMIDNDYSAFDTPEKKEALIQNIFRKHKTSQAQWDTSLAWYSDKIEIYLKMNDSVRARLQRHQKEVETTLNAENLFQYSFVDRSILLTELPHYFLFSDLNPKHGFRFHLDSVALAERITEPVFDFSFDVGGLPSIATTDSVRLKAALVLSYKDTTIYEVSNIRDNGNYTHEIHKYIDNDTLRTLTGYIRLQDFRGMYRHVWLNNLRLGALPSSLQNEKASSPVNLEKEVPMQLNDES